MAITDRAVALSTLARRLGERLDFLPLLLARLTVGYVFVHSGWGKLHHLPDVIEYFRGLGIPAPELQAPLSASTELIAGTLVLLGLLTRVASLPLVVIMLVALGTAKREEIESLNALFGLVEYVYIVLLVHLVVKGGGAASLDALLGRRFAASPSAATPATVA